MTSQTRATLKNSFAQGDKPQGTDYSNLIDSFISLADTDAQVMNSQLTIPTLVVNTKISGNPSFASINCTGVVSASSVYVNGIVHSSGGFVVGPSGSQGTGVLVTRVTIAQNNTAANGAAISLPTGANILGFSVDVEQPFATGAGVTAAEITVSARAGVVICKIGVSASTRRYSDYFGDGAQTVNSGAYRNVTKVMDAYVSIFSSSTAISAGQAMLSVEWTV